MSLIDASGKNSFLELVANKEGVAHPVYDVVRTAPKPLEVNILPKERRDICGDPFIHAACNG